MLKKFELNQLFIIKSAIKIFDCSEPNLMRLHKKECSEDCGFLCVRCAKIDIDHLCAVVMFAQKRHKDFIFDEVFLKKIYDLIEFFVSDKKFFNQLQSDLKLSHAYTDKDLIDILSSILTICESD